MARTLTRMVPCEPEECFEAFCDVDALPQWVPEVRTAHVLWRLPGGRAGEARFVGSNDRGERLTYDLSYSYDPIRLRVAWHPSEDSGYAVRGFASFERAAGACLVSYALDLEGRDAPERAVHLERAERALAAFADWMTWR